VILKEMSDIERDENIHGISDILSFKKYYL